MESNYDKVVKLTAEILKSWTPDPGTVSPFSSSSSNHSEINDNHLEYYVQQDSKNHFMMRLLQFLIQIFGRMAVKK